MPKKQAEQAKGAILNATITLLLEQGAGGLTVDRVAKRAGVAKGLVNYHFQTKDRLLAAAVRLIGDRRLVRWRETFTSLDLQRAVDDTWRLIVAERDEGLLRAMVSTYSEPGERIRTAVDETTAGFAQVVADGVESLLERAGARARVPADQLGWLVAATIAGAGLHLVSGVNATTVENAYAAAWLAVLGLAG